MFVTRGFSPAKGKEVRNMRNITIKLAVGLAGVMAAGALLTGVALATTNEEHQIKLDPQSDVNPVDTKHTVTATVSHLDGSPMPGVIVSFQVSSGPNAGQVSDPGECSTDPNCMTDANGQTSWTYPGLGGVGTDLIVACVEHLNNSNSNFNTCAQAKKDWVDKTPPKAACLETTNPHGKNTPPAGSTTLPGPKGGQNEDGFYLVGAEDNLDPDVEIFVNGFGPYSSGDKLKVTEAPGTTPSEKKMGSSNGQAGEIVAHLILDSDPVMSAVDDAGNKTEVSCLVPPPK